MCLRFTAVARTPTAQTVTMQESAWSLSLVPLLLAEVYLL